MSRYQQRQRRRAKKEERLTGQEKKKDINQIPTGPGHRLKIAREAMHLSRDDVATELRLGKDFINNIERDYYEPSVPLAFTRGYLRAYAKLVKIPANDIISAFDDLAIEEPKSKIDWKNSGKKSRSFNDKNLRWFSYGIICGLICLLVLWWYTHYQQTLQEQQAVEQQSEATENQQHIPKIVEANFTEIGKAAGVADLGMQFSDQCWVEVRDAQGAAIYVGLKSKGDQLALSGQTPFKVLLGNPRAVDIQLNQEHIDLSAYQPQKTARVVIG